ncbi:MAG: TIGR04255 family protein [Candidatus Omnitrophica bacterium]|nr:TIGR04255 family protein [Candidatus Omnitrophota bacterium]
MTQNVTSFPNPPITEALLDIRVNLPKEITLDTLATFQGEIKERFPTKKEKYKWEGGVQFQAGGAPKIIPSSSGTIGYLFHAADGKKIVQARLDGYTFNKLKPYTNWEEFHSEAKELWEIYLKIAKPVNVTRVALRYINRIEIPLPFKDFKEYILTVPEIGDNIPSALSGFFTRLIIPNPDIQADAVITETMEKIDDKAKVLPFIFDIDVSRKYVFEPQSDEIWQTLNKLREFKNQIFLNSMTEKAKELFK